jgi:type IV pilus assembly protein PilC
MPQFIYEAKTRSGEVRTGTMEADDEAAAGRSCGSSSSRRVKVKKKGFSFGPAGAAASPPRTW